MDFVVALDCEITVEPEDGEKLDIDAVIEDHLHAVMNELVGLGAGDASIELDLTTATVTFSVLVAASNPVGAAAAASGFVRTAIHAAGGGTPDWPGADDEAWAVKLVALRSEAVAVSAEPVQCSEEDLVPA